MTLLIPVLACVPMVPASGSGLSAAPAAFTIQPEAQPSPEEVQASLPPRRYGAAGGDWLTVNAGWAPDLADENDVALSIAWSRFFVEDVEFGVEGAAWYFDQEIDDQVGASASMLLRWHFVNNDRWSLFLDAGIGLLGSGGNVPDDGSSFNFLPRAGVGLTRRISDDGTRLQLGVRWHHISNARIFGDGDNPARDRAMVYGGLVFPLR